MSWHWAVLCSDHKHPSRTEAPGPFWPGQARKLPLAGASCIWIRIHIHFSCELILSSLLWFKNILTGHCPENWRVLKWKKLMPLNTEPGTFRPWINNNWKQWIGTWLPLQICRLPSFPRQSLPTPGPTGDVRERSRKGSKCPDKCTGMPIQGNQQPSYVTTVG